MESFAFLVFGMLVLGVFSVWALRGGKAAEHRSAPHGLPDLLLYASLIDDGILLLQDGALMAAWSFTGPDLASATHDEMAVLTARLNCILKLGSNWMIHCDAVRTASPEYPQRGAFPDGVTRVIDDERKAQFLQEGSHFESEYFLAVTYLPPAQAEEKLRGFMFEGGEGKERPVAERAVEYFKARVGSFHEVFASQMKVKRLKSREVVGEGGFKIVYDDLLQYVRRCVTGDDFPFVQPEIPVFLHDLIGCRDFRAGIAPRIGDLNIRIVAIDGFPHTSHPGVLAALDTLPFDYRWNTRAILLDTEAAKGLINKHLKKWRGKTRGFIDQLMGRAPKSVDLFAVEMVGDATNAVAEASAGDVQFAYYTSNILIYDKEEESADEKSGQVAKVLQNLGFAARIESINATEAWRGSLPGDGYRNVRRIMLNTINLADCLPIAAVWTGSRVNPSHQMPANSPALMFATSVGSTVFRINLHVSDIGHTLILGPSGAGKSTLLGMLVSQWFRYPDAQCVVFDKGYSMYVLNKAASGQFYDLAAEGSPVNFCPLGELEDSADISWAADYVESLCELAGQRVDPAQRQAILKGVQMLADSPHRTLTELVINIQDQAIKDAFQHYTLSGALGGLLEAKKSESGLKQARFTTFEMEHLMEMGDKAVVPVLTYLFRQIDKRLDGRPTLIVLDEAWILLQHEMFKERIREWLKTFRKKNAAVVLATQSISDVINSPIRDVILESCPTKILLPNAEANNDNSRGFYTQLGLNSREIQILAAATPKRQYYFYSPVGRRLVSLGLGPVALSFVGVSDTESKRRAEAMMQRNPQGWVEQWLRERGLDRWADYYATQCVPRRVVGRELVHAGGMK